VRTPHPHLLDLPALGGGHRPATLVAGSAAQHERQARLGGGVVGELVRHAAREVLQRVYRHGAAAADAALGAGLHAARDRRAAADHLPEGVWG
jgi:hypothetical protein